jgi:60 kDa SS-A/Ro ribonucleoprotein
MVQVYRDAAVAARPLRPGEALTHAGGIAHEADKWTRLRRYLILGSELGTYYMPESAFTAQQIGVVQDCLFEDWQRTLDEIVQVSDAGRAPKNDPAILALAMATCLAGQPQGRSAAFALLPKVCRTGTHLLHFAAYREALGGGWGRGMRRAVGNWFAEKTPQDMAYQAVKYPSRDGWALADLLRLSHPKLPPEHSFVAGYVVDGWPEQGPEIGTIDAATWLVVVETLRVAGLTATEKAGMIRTHRIPREAVPTELLNDPGVWDALLADMPMTAMIRNLGKMSNVGVLAPGSDASLTVVSRLMDPERLRKARVHPIAILAALKVYEQGKGERGKLTWTPDRTILAALDQAFYLAFGTVPATGLRIRAALDVSSSMDGSKVNGMPYLSAREAAAAMALVTAAVEPDVHFLAYSHTLVPLTIRPSMRLDEVIRTMRAIPFGGTLCSLPIQQATASGAEVDLFVSYTDSETYNGAGGGYYYGLARDVPGSDMTASEALRAYRLRSGIAARHAVVAFTANEVSIADPRDAGQMDFVGLDSHMPHLLADFATGAL